MNLTVARLPPTTHAVLCYENTETARQVLMSYLNGARERNEAVHILSSSLKSLDVFLQSIGLHTPFEEERTKCIEVDKFCSEGINYEKAMVLAKPTLDAVRRWGSNGLRIFALANDYLDYVTPEEVLQFESQMGNRFSIPVTGICAYDLVDARAGWDRILLDLLKAHGVHVFQGLAGSDEEGILE